MIFCCQMQLNELFWSILMPVFVTVSYFSPCHALCLSFIMPDGLRAGRCLLPCSLENFVLSVSPSITANSSPGTNSRRGCEEMVKIFHRAVYILIASFKNEFAGADQNEDCLERVFLQAFKLIFKLLLIFRPFTLFLHFFLVNCHEGLGFTLIDKWIH